jgi:hypothetical protein
VLEVVPDAALPPTTPFTIQLTLPSAVRLAKAANCKELPAVRTAWFGEMERVPGDGCAEITGGGLLGDNPPQPNANRHRPDRIK